MAIDRAKFFTNVRSNIFHGHLNQKQVDGINVILDEWERSSFKDLRWLSYMLSTTFHETAETMQPVHEYGGNSYFTRLYGVEGQNPSRARRMGNTEIGDGIKYCGRGYVQLTWKNNYKRMGDLIGVDLVTNPDLAMEPKNAVKIMFVGMTGEPKNTFSGVNLSRYFNDVDADWEGARHIINGTDHADIVCSDGGKVLWGFIMNNETDTWAKRFSAWGALFVTGTVLGLFGMGLILSYWAKIDPSVTFVNLMETLKTLAILVVGYWVGSSNSSQKKDDTIAKNSEALANSTPIMPVTTVMETKSDAPSVTKTTTEPKTE